MLAAQVQFLERENRKLRRNLRDEYAMAALTGLLAHSGSTMWPAEAAAKAALKYADAALAAR